MHKEVEAAVTRSRMSQIRAHSKRINIAQPNISVDDFVVVRRPKKTEQNSQFLWSGPRRIIGVQSSLVYQVIRPDSSIIKVIHCARLQLYRKSTENSDVSEELTNLAERTESQYELVEKTIDIGQYRNGIFLQVQWLGIPDKRDWKRVSLPYLYTDVPDTVETFLCFKTGKKRFSGDQ